MGKLLPVFLFFACHVAIAQEQFQYKMQFDVGVGGCLFTIPNSTTTADNPRAFGTSLGLDATFKVKGPFSVGGSFLYHQYDTKGAGTENTKFLEAKSGTVQFIANYHLIDRKKINFAIGSGFGIHKFDYERIDLVDSTEYRGNVKLKGSSFSLNAQLRWYFIKNLGLFLRGQFIVYGGRVDSFVINGQSYDRMDGKKLDEAIYSFRGRSVQLGLSLRF
jgi:hypothetical protein